MTLRWRDHNRLQLLPYEIHVWCVEDTNINDSELLKRYNTCLNNKERQKQAYFHSAEHRHQYLVTRALTRTVLSLYTDVISPDQWQFDINEYGRPSIINADFRHIKFSLSHTENLVTLAVTLQCDVGIDVEWLLRSSNFLSIADRYFSPSEYKNLKALPIKRQKTCFFDLWTLKEAYIKACGTGLSIPLDQFSFAFFNNDKINIDFHPDRQDQSELWKFWQLYYGNEHQLAVALKADFVTTPYELIVRKAIPLQQYEELDCVAFRQSF